jgi:hypothetical protein
VAAGKWRRELRLGAIERRRPRSERDQHGRRCCSDRSADRWASAVSDFSNLSKTGSTLKIKMGALTCSKNFQFLHVAFLGYHEQFYQLYGHQIPNIKRFKNPGTDSIFESLINFKRDLNLLEKSDKFSKIPS